ncbi:MAG TPA: hypothetical protein DCY40_06620, partial [Actinobacteria bacterium]|nr:hypothetical protein [Actinomycetota bacterium]
MSVNGPVSVARSLGGGAPVAERSVGLPVFELEGLAVEYGSFRAVDDIDLTIGANEITAFIGPSGCGKTTVLRCLNR